MVGYVGYDNLILNCQWSRECPVLLHVVRTLIGVEPREQRPGGA